MDGFRLGKKRLKVQRKREHEGDHFNFEDDFALMSHESEFGAGAGGTPGHTTPTLTHPLIYTL